MFAELLGKEAGYCKGKGGSMHIADPDTGNLGANAIVGGSAGIATGAAFSAKRLKTGQVAVCFFGEGALGQGLLYEVMNMAALWKLPVIYVCENNLYNEYTHFSETHRRRHHHARRRRSAFPAKRSMGRTCATVYATAKQIVDRVRGGDGPLPRVQHLPLSRPSRGRCETRLLPLEAGRADVEDRRDPVQLLGDWLIGSRSWPIVPLSIRFKPK